MKILGIDYGTRRIGIALSDDGQRLAFPKHVFDNDNTIFEKIEELIKKEGVTKIVLGDSKDFKMRNNPIMNAIENFKKQLEEKFNLKVVLYPEVLSSHQAAKMAGGKNMMIDASAAAIILQSYLDSIMIQ